MVAPAQPQDPNPTEPSAEPQPQEPTETVTVSKTEHDKILAALKEANAEAAKYRHQIKELMPKVEKGSELEKSLTDFSARLEQAERRASFLEEAAKPEIQCKNPRAAWLLAEAEGLFDKKGLPDWAAIKRDAPELFGQPVANANAGQGTQQKPNPHKDMNAFIRKAAGRN